MDPEAAQTRADEVLARLGGAVPASVSDHPAEPTGVDQHETHGTAWGAATSSFLFFASGAVVPVLPYLLGLGGGRAVLVACGLVGVALLVTGAITGLLSGTSPVTRALRQLGIGFGAAAVTYLLGLVFGTTVG
jgi:VIT1/CCC1 family predicted Fe2+/Mn2+ transporter